MPAPVFNPALTGSAPNQLASWDAYQAEIQRVMAAIWNGKADLENSGSIFPSRLAAVESGQENIPSVIRRIVTEEGNFLVLRGPLVENDDPLFPVAPFWGVVARFPNDRILDGKADLSNSGKVFASRAGAVAVGQSALPQMLGAITTREGDYLALRTPGSEADDPLFSTSPRWGVLARFPARELLDSANGRIDELSDALSRNGGAGQILAAIRDEAGNGTFMTARTSDGGPTGPAAALIARSMREVGLLAFEYRVGTPILDDLLFAIADETGVNLSPDLMLRRSDGRLTDSAIASIAERLPIPRPKPDGSWPHPLGGRFARYDADMRQIVSWGSSSPEIASGAWAAMAAELGAQFVPKAKGGQTNEHVLIQMGAVRPQVTGGALDAAAGSFVQVQVETMNATRAQSLRATQGLLINGAQSIAGQLSYSGTSLRFTRRDAGAAVVLSSGWRFWSDDERLRNRMALIWSAKNDITEGQAAAGVVAEVRTITDYLSPASPRYLVIGLFPNPWYSDEQVSRTNQADLLMADVYGDLFIPVMPSLLGTQIFADLGLSPTAEDLTERARGRVPPSLMGDPYHLTVAAYGWITENLIKPKLTDELGWY